MIGRVQGPESTTSGAGTHDVAAFTHPCARDRQHRGGAELALAERRRPDRAAHAGHGAYGGRGDSAPSRPRHRPCREAGSAGRDRPGADGRADGHRWGGVLFGVLAYFAAVAQRGIRAWSPAIGVDQRGQAASRHGPSSGSQDETEHRRQQPLGDRSGSETETGGTQCRLARLVHCGSPGRVIREGRVSRAVSLRPSCSTMRARVVSRRHPTLGGSPWISTMTGR